MENILKLIRPGIDCEPSRVEEFLEKGVQLKVWSDTEEIKVYNHNEEVMDSTVFGLWLEFGEDYGQSIMLEASIDKLELFIKSLVIHIDIVKSQIRKKKKKQIELGGRP